MIRRAARPAGLVALLLAALLGVAGCSPLPLLGDPTVGAPETPRARPAEPDRPVMDVAAWQARYDEAASGVRDQNLELSRSLDSRDFYQLSYTFDSLASMISATGEPRYVDDGLVLAENMVASARPSDELEGSSFSDRYLGWTSPAEDDEVALYESYAWRYVTRFLRVAAEDPAVDAAQRARIDRLVRFTATDIVDKWVSRGANDYVFRSRTHMASHWAFIALEMERLDPARAPMYADIVRQIDSGLPNYPSSLRGQLRPADGEPDAYFWNDVWGNYSHPGQDVSHGNAVVSYVVEAHDLGSYWTDDDMERFTRTLTAFVIGSPNDHPEFVDGTGSSNGWIADGFVKLGRYDPAVQAQLETYDVQNAQFDAAMAENARDLATRGASR